MIMTFSVIYEMVEIHHELSKIRNEMHFLVSLERNLDEI